MIMEMGAQNTHLYDVENLVTSSLKKGRRERNATLSCSLFSHSRSAKVPTLLLQADRRLSMHLLYAQALLLHLTRK